MSVDAAVHDALAAGARALDLVLTPASLAGLAAYVALVARWQHVTNLTGARDPVRFVREHVVDCLAVVPHLGSGRVLDIGSGAGLPGLVIAGAGPSRAVVRRGPRARRARFLTQVSIELALTNVEVICARAESYRPAVAPATCLSRAFGSLLTFVRAAQPLVAADGRLLAMKAGIDPGDRAAAEAIAGPATVLPLTVPGFATRHLVSFGPRPATAT